MNRYNIYRTGQFDELWHWVKSTGVIDSVIGEDQLAALARFLSVDPRIFPEFEASGERVDLRWAILFTTETLRIEVWYSVVEDDLTVYLESVEIIRPPQGLLPGFDP